MKSIKSSSSNDNLPLANLWCLQRWVRPMKEWQWSCQLFFVFTIETGVVQTFIIILRPALTTQYNICRWIYIQTRVYVSNDYRLCSLQSQVLLLFGLMRVANNFYLFDIIMYFFLLFDYFHVTYFLISNRTWCFIVVEYLFNLIFSNNKV